MVDSNKISNSTKNKKAVFYEAEKLMEELGVIDLMITAHQHQTIVGQDHETYYVQAGQDAKSLYIFRLILKREQQLMMLKALILK